MNKMEIVYLKKNIESRVISSFPFCKRISSHHHIKLPMSNRRKFDLFRTWIKSIRKL